LKSFLKHPFQMTCINVCISVFVLQIDSLDPRGVQLGALFMTGVDMAMFANDACGQPVPWENCCPWMYFDGKLFQSKLARASRDKAQLLDLCDGQVAGPTHPWAPAYISLYCFLFCFKRLSMSTVIKVKSLIVLLPHVHHNSNTGPF